MVDYARIDGGCGYYYIVSPFVHGGAATINIWNIITDAHIVVDGAFIEIDATGYFRYKFEFDETAGMYLCIGTAPGIEEYLILTVCMQNTEILDREALLIGMSCA